MTISSHRIDGASATHDIGDAGSCRLAARRYPLQRGHINLLHAEHRLHRTAGAAGVAVAEQATECFWNDLPGHAEFVGEPGALVGAAAVGGECRPLVIDLGLILAVNEE